MLTSHPTDTTNYNNASKDVTINVLKKDASVTPDAKTKVYGDADPTLTGTLSGFLAADGVTATYSRTAGETVAGSPYTISATLSPAGVLGNYNITYNTANFTITTKPASVTPDAKSKVYGEADPTLTGTLSGFLAADGVTATYSRTPGETVAGSPYTISATLSPSGVLGNYNVTYNTANFTITPRPVTVTASTDTKVYDGTKNSAGTPTVTLGTLAAGDTGVFAQTFDSSNAGSRTLTPTGSIHNASLVDVTANYNITFATASGTITKRPITVTAQTNTKVYDGTPSASATPVVTSALSPAIVSGDTANFIETYDNKNAGTVKTLAASGSVNDGNGGNNYQVTFVEDHTGVITARPITVTAQTNTKVYDGGTSALATPVVTSALTPAIVSGDTANFIETYDNKNAGTAKTLTASGSVNDGNSGNNYTVTFVQDHTGVINKAPLTITAQTNTKTYDGNTSAVATPTFSGLQTGDTVTGLAEAYTDPNAGTGKTLTVSAYTVNDGNSGNNYTVSTVDNHTGVINKANATIVVTPYNVAYDGNPHTATVTSITGVNGETGATVGTVDVSNTTHTLPGDYPTDPWTFTGGTNYNNANGTVHDIIGYGVCSAGYGPGGTILPPIKTDGSSVYNRKGGSTIPVKFTVCDASATPSPTRLRSLAPLPAR